jgi:hypothetical protein
MDQLQDDVPFAAALPCPSQLREIRIWIPCAEFCASMASDQRLFGQKLGLFESRRDDVMIVPN